MPCAEFESVALSHGPELQIGALEVWGGERAPQTVWSNMAVRSQNHWKHIGNVQIRAIEPSNLWAFATKPKAYLEIGAIGFLGKFQKSIS